MADHLYDTAAIETIPPSGILISDHFIEPFGYKVNRAHGTRDWLITYTLSGKGRYLIETDIQSGNRVESKALFCTAGDIVILAPGTPHHYAAAEQANRWDFLWAHFVPRTHWNQWLKLPEFAKGLVFLHIEEEEALHHRILSSFQRILNDSKGISAFHEELALNALEEIVLLLAKKYTNDKTWVLDSRINDVMQILTQNMSAPHTVADLAKRVCLSPSRLAHIFKEQMGDSIMEILLKMRLRQAARMLEFTTRQVTEIAQDVGFHSLYYFSRQFSKFYGMSPTLYRKKSSIHDQFI